MKKYGENQNLLQSATSQCFQFYKVRKMLSDIVNKSSVSFFITKVAKEEFRGSCCSRQSHYMTCKNRSTTVHEQLLLDLRHDIARLAWLI